MDIELPSNVTNITTTSHQLSAMPLPAAEQGLSTTVAIHQISKTQSTFLHSLVQIAAGPSMRTQVNKPTKMHSVPLEKETAIFLEKEKDK